MTEAPRFPTVSGPSLRTDPMLDELRQIEPVAKVQLPFGQPAWLVTKYDDVKRVYDDDAFCRRGTTDEGVPRLSAVVRMQPGTLNSMDDEEHKRLRAFVGKAFSTRRVEGLRPRAQEVTAGLLDAIEAAGPPADLVESLALPLPIAMICELLGVPFADRDTFRGWSDKFMSDGLAADGSLEEVFTAFTSLSAYLSNLVDERRAAPRDDLLSALVQADDGVDRLMQQEIVSLSVGLLVGGFETTAHMIGKSVLCLLTDRDAWERLREDPALVPGAVEELLRHISLATGTSLPWCAREQVELSGARIEVGDYVMPATGSANRDEAYFKEPDQLDIERKPNPHLAFGHGAHFCIGAGLARMEMQCAIEGLVTRFPDLSLAVPADEVPWRVGSAVWGLAELPVIL